MREAHILQNDLQYVVDKINQITYSPVELIRNRVFNVGCYYIDFKTPSKPKLMRCMSVKGDSKQVLDSKDKRDLFNQMLAFIEGVKSLDDGGNTLSIIWTIDDVKSIEARLTDEQCRLVLQSLKRISVEGISFDTIEIVISNLFGDVCK